MAKKRNPVRDAVDKVGGVTCAANICGVSNQTIYNWIEASRVKGTREAFLLADAAEIDVKQLVNDAY